MLMALARAMVAAACVLPSAASVALAQDQIAQFYRGKTVNIVIGSAPGGGYDGYGRLIAHHLGKHIPGHPSVIAQNMPGAGSNKAAGYIALQAPRDGTMIGAIQPGAVLQPLLSDLRMQHDPSKFIFVGSATNDVYLCLVRSDAPVKTFQDTFTTEVVLGASAEGATLRDLPTMLDNLLGVKLRLVTGYAGSREVMIAIERGEVQGICGFGWASLELQHPDWISSGKARIIAQEDLKGHPEVNKMGVPRTIDFAKTEEVRQVMELVYSQNLFGRPYVLAPGVPADRVAALRKAFMDAIHDPELIAEAERTRFDLGAMSGEDLQALVAKLYALPARVSARAKQALIYKPPAK